MKNSPPLSAVRPLAWIALLLCLAIVAFGQTAPSPIPLLSPTWSNSYSFLTQQPGQWRPSLPAFSDDGNCIAIAGNGEAQVISRTGRTLWKWNYRAVTRFLASGPLAVSPKCDAIALAGDSRYKYVWIADRTGHSVSIRLTSTPLGVAFDRTGQSLAVGNGAWAIDLYSRRGQLLWQRKPDAPCCLASDFSFSRDNAFLLVRTGGSGVLRIDGSVVWTAAAWGMNAADDLRTFVDWSAPNHGPGPGAIRLLDVSGTQLWSSTSDDPAAVVTPAGDKVLARVRADQDVPMEKFDEPQDTVLQLIARDGALLKQFPGLDGRPVAISPDGKTVLLETGRSLDAIDFEGKRLYSIAAFPFAYRIAPDFSAVVVFSTGSDATLEYFKLK